MKQIKKLIKCHNFLIKQSKLPSSLYIRDISGGLIRVAETLLCNLNGGLPYNDEGSIISEIKIADFCIYNVSRLYKMNKDTLSYFKYNQILGDRSFEMYSQSPSGAKYFGDEFLYAIGTGRREVVFFITDKDKHPLRKYIYIPHEESVKRRFHNQPSGFILCKRGTTLWSAQSSSCSDCIYSEKCKDVLKERNSELHRLRTE